ncbi:MAG: winged helix-turn-helix transcriptional regulator [Verrucomicrobiales bacterium]|nr:winged helix-turn-helix transcriptional regulator [Verrucomicrobiales bacterium]MCP5526972.1 winged helix-turn-helix transcriptional regulator [Verrucomicrobiales bacterium]
MVAARFKALSDPTRLQLVQALHERELNVSQLVEISGTTQANVSKHLAVLAEGMILGRRRAGSNVFYYIADDSILQICDLMCRKLHEELDRRAAELD